MVRRNTRGARQVWGRLGVILRQEEADPIMSAAIYRAAVQELLFKRVETWVLSAAMENRIAGVHMEVFRKMPG